MDLMAVILRLSGLLLRSWSLVGSLLSLRTEWVRFSGAGFAVVPVFVIFVKVELVLVFRD